MKKALIAIWICGPLLVLFRSAASYMLGYTEAEIAALAVNYGIIYFAQFLLFVALIVLTSILLVRLSDPAAFALAIVATFCFWPTVVGTVYLVTDAVGEDSDAYFLFRGLSNRLESEYTLDGLRHLSSEALACGLLESQVGPMNVANSIQQTQNEEAALALLKKKYPFLFSSSSLGPWVSGDANGVRFEWQDGAKYWGFVVIFKGRGPGPAVLPGPEMQRLTPADFGAEGDLEYQFSPAPDINMYYCDPDPIE